MNDPARYPRSATEPTMDAGAARAERVVLWDFDGTLAHRDGMWSGCLLECLALVDGPSLSRNEIRPHIRDRFPWHQPDVGHGHLGDADAWWAHLLPLFIAAYHAAGIQRETAVAASRLVREQYVRPSKWTVVPDAVPVLRSLHAAGWRNVVLSNHVPELPALVNALGLGDHIDRVFTSALVGWEKPNPKFYATAVKALGQPSQVWMIGDNPIADIAGAEAVGIPAILVGGDVGLADAIAQMGVVGWEPITDD